MSLHEIPSLHHHFIEKFLRYHYSCLECTWYRQNILEGSRSWLYHIRASAINLNLYYRDLTGGGELETSHWEYLRGPTTKGKKFLPNQREMAAMSKEKCFKGPVRRNKCIENRGFHYYLICIGVLPCVWIIRGMNIWAIFRKVSFLPYDGLKWLSETMTSSFFTTLIVHRLLSFTKFLQHLERIRNKAFTLWLPPLVT